MEKAFLVPIICTKKQEKFFRQHANISRLLYNETISLWKAKYFRKKAYQKLMGQKRPINKSEKGRKDPTYTDFNSKFPWLEQYSSYVRRDAVINANDAFKKFFKGLSSYPKYKGKSCQPKLINYQGSSIKLKSDSQNKFATHIKLSSKSGWVKLARKNYLPLDCKIIQAAFSKRAGQWFVSVAMHVPEFKKPILTNEVIGGDLGGRTILTLSNKKEYKLKKEKDHSSLTIASEQTLNKVEKQLKVWQRKQARRFQKCSKKQSNGFLEAKEKVQKLFLKLDNMRADIKNKITHNVVDHNPEKIILENLNIKGMMQNKRIAPIFQKIGMYNIKQQIIYKSKWRGIKVSEVPTNFPSTQTCSACGNIKGKNGTKKQNSSKVYKCDKCGYVIDRDINAAINLAIAPQDKLKDLT